MKGLGVIKEEMGKSAQTLKIEDGKHVVIRILTPADEVIGIYEHTEQINGSWRTMTCLGKDKCPMCQAGKRGSFKAYLLVADRTDSDKVKIFKASKTVVKQLLGLVEEYGDITARDFKVSRTGKGLDTVYQFFPRDPQEFSIGEVELPNLEEVVAPMTREAMLETMNGAGAVETVAPTENAESGNPYPF